MTWKWIVPWALLAVACGEPGVEITEPEQGSPTQVTTPDGNVEAGTSTDSDEVVASPDTPDDGSPVADVPETPEDPTPPEDPTEPAPSNGCALGTTPNGGPWTIQHDGMTRSFRVHIPNGYVADTATPVVINYHGRSMTGSMQASFSGMNPVADANGFIVVYPEGTGASEQTWNGGLCCGSAQADNVDDVGFTAAMLDELEAKLCVDTGRVYTVGMSNGGYMSHRIGCELADRITAIGAVAGTMGVFDCSPARPVPTLHFHGTSDNVVRYGGFVGSDGARGSVETWRDLNGCQAASEVYFSQGDVSCERWTGCDENAEVRLCTIDGGGHTWPGGTDFTFGVLGKTTDAISASEHFWEFFSAHAM